MSASTERPDEQPVSIEPPPTVKVAALLAAFESLGILVVAGIVIAGREDADLKWALATAAYFLVLALLVAAVSRGLFQGRRWARTPAIVINLIVLLVGFYLAIPSGQLAPGIALMLLGGITVALLVSKPTSAWIRSFPSLFDAEPDR